MEDARVWIAIANDNIPAGDLHDPLDLLEHLGSHNEALIAAQDGIYRRLVYYNVERVVPIRDHVGAVGDLIGKVWPSLATAFLHLLDHHATYVYVHLVFKAIIIHLLRQDGIATADLEDASILLGDIGVEERLEGLPVLEPIEGGPRVLGVALIPIEGVAVLRH